MSAFLNLAAIYFGARDVSRESRAPRNLPGSLSSRDSTSWGWWMLLNHFICVNQHQVRECREGWESASLFGLLHPAGPPAFALNGDLQSVQGKDAPSLARGPRRVKHRPGPSRHNERRGCPSARV